MLDGNKSLQISRDSSFFSARWNSLNIVRLAQVSRSVSPVRHELPILALARLSSLHEMAEVVSVALEKNKTCAATRVNLGESAVYSVCKLLERALVTPTKSSSKDDIKVNVIVTKMNSSRQSTQGAQQRTFDWNDNILQYALNTTQSGILFHSMHGDGSGFTWSNLCGLWKMLTQVG